VNLYFLRSAKQIAEKEANSDGHEYIVPSFTASQMVFPARSRTAALSTWRNSSIVLKLRMMPSAR
jgi:hypothetical protein